MTSARLARPLAHYRSLGLILVSSGLMALGSVCVFSASARLASYPPRLAPIADQGLRQVILVPISILVMGLVSRLDYRVLDLTSGLKRSATIYLICLSVVLLVLTLIPGIGIERNAARRWLPLYIGPMGLTFQPSELAKWALVLFVASACHTLHFRITSFSRHLLPILCVSGLVVGLILLEDFGTAVFVALTVFAILMVGGARPLHMLGLVCVCLCVFSVALLAHPYRIQRLLAFTQSDRWSQTVGYQAEQSLIAIGSGGILGKGLGNGVSKYGHLPEDTTDFVLSVIGEELGLVGTLLTICLFVAFIWLGWRTAKRSTDPLGRILAFAIVLTIGLQAAINIGVVTVLLPTKGIPLPFVSGGGSHLLITAAVVGLLLNIQRQSSNMPDQTGIFSACR